MKKYKKWPKKTEKRAELEKRGKNMKIWQKNGSEKIRPKKKLLSFDYNVVWSAKLVECEFGAPRALIFACFRLNVVSFLSFFSPFILHATCNCERCENFFVSFAKKCNPFETPKLNDSQIRMAISIDLCAHRGLYLWSTCEREKIMSFPTSPSRNTREKKWFGSQQFFVGSHSSRRCGFRNVTSPKTWPDFVFFLHLCVCPFDSSGPKRMSKHPAIGNRSIDWQTKPARSHRVR